jgi:hypothetical protein
VSSLKSKTENNNTPKNNIMKNITVFCMPAKLINCKDLSLSVWHGIQYQLIMFWKLPMEVHSLFTHLGYTKNPRTPLYIGHTQ